MPSLKELSVFEQEFITKINEVVQGEIYKERLTISHIVGALHVITGSLEQVAVSTKIVRRDVK